MKNYLQNLILFQDEIRQSLGAMHLIPLTKEKLGENILSVVRIIGILTRKDEDVE